MSGWNVIHTALDTPDEGYSYPIALPDSFYYYGSYYDTIYVSINGYVSFIEPDNFYVSNRPLPTQLSPKGMLAVFWDDLSIIGEMESHTAGISE